MATAAKTVGGAVMKGTGSTLMSIDFEVFGKVQGVFFRKYTVRNSKKHGLVGWVQNTSHGTVLGQMQGAADKIKIMKQWLQKEGSPRSKIQKAEFRSERVITELEHDTFRVLRP
ncbi:acylphosphatase-1-like isoform X2 [Saccoglossus kowalevskii]|uniref:Acylphosphatase n=1 Tax=Saccoglossus kowalevskii TaxID=10224 RepID=A0ABM0GQS1_SACKO|nr:PREDICTED: acylphosphatase-1-like [Saccoglossus kowalevskii]